MSEFIAVMQVALVIACTWPMATFGRCFLRWVRRSGKASDPLKAATFLIAFCASSFPVRWLLEPSPIRGMVAADIATWAALHVLMILAVLLLTGTVIEAGREPA